MRAAGSGAHKQPDTGVRCFACQPAQRLGECGRVVGLVERVDHDGDCLPPLKQAVDQTVKIGLRHPDRGGGKRTHDLISRGSTSVDCDVDSLRWQVSDRVLGGHRHRHADAISRIGHGDEPGQHR